MDDRAPTREMPPDEHDALSRPTLPAVDGPVHAVEALGRRCEELEKALRWAMTHPCGGDPPNETCTKDACDDHDPCRAAWALLGRTP